MKTNVTRQQRKLIIIAAREAATAGDHAVARILFAKVGIQYLDKNK